MIAKPEKFDYISVFIKPYQQRITLYMTFHTTLLTRLYRGFILYIANIVHFLT
jgi:hypothetical protein